VNYNARFFPGLLSMRIVALVLALLALSGCGIVYTIDIQQGNYVTDDLAAKLRLGMTKAEVRQLLGTPLLSDPFHANRWDYYFSNVRARRPDVPSRLTIHFENDKVASFAGQARPAPPPPVGNTAPPQPVVR
jgi:outer membrane protein assembly factor BamE